MRAPSPATAAPTPRPSARAPGRTAAAPAPKRPSPARGAGKGGPGAKAASPRASSGYQASSRRWHQAPPGAGAPLDAEGRPLLVLVSINTGERVELPAQSDAGGFDARSLDLAARVLRDTQHDLEHPVDPALLDVMYQAQRHFKAPEVRVISGYRAPSGRGRSNHGKGRAADVIVPGARDADLSAWARGLGFLGVGLYPTSGFCHLDVRDRAYAWVDRSGPGQRRREVAVGKREAAKADAEAQQRQRHGVPAYALPSGSVGEVWQGRGAAAPADEAPEPEDDEAADEGGG
ncbi:MAG TPA: DUF882 domain-containing protein [Polyangiaceae bacterium]|nr:DUF882 domain-containing protein [Polyangiaceae bacterium]